MPSKILILLVTSIILSLVVWPEASAQTSGYTYTPEGLLVFADVVETDSLNQDELFDLAVRFFSSDKNKEGRLKKDNQKKTLISSKSFSLYEKGIISKQPSAEIQFELLLEFKHERYRYLYKDFSYLPFERNRYGKYEAVQRKKKSLENLISNEQEWSKLDEAFDMQMQGEIERLIHALDTKMTQPEEDTATNIIRSDKAW